MIKWLIRSSDRKIFGPVSREKVVKLYEDKIIKDDDEICAGNGYWFYLREKEFLEKYLFGDETQPFDPMSESKDMLTQSTQPAQAPPEEAKFPPPSELDYPDNPSSQEDTDDFSDITLISDINLMEDNNQNQDLEKQRESKQKKEVPPQTFDISAKKSTAAPKKKAFIRDPSAPPNVVPPSKILPQRDDRYLIILFIILLTILGIVLKKHTNIFFFIGAIMWGQESYAVQTTPPLSRKRIVFRSQHGELVGVPTIKGIVFEIQSDKKVNQCPLFEKSSFPITWYLTEKKKSIENCSSLSAEAMAINKITKTQSQDKMLDIIKKSSKTFASIDYKKVINIYKIKKKLRKRAVIENVLEQTNTFLKQPDYSQGIKVLRSLEKIEDHLLIKIAQMAVYHQLGNQGRVRTLSHDIFSQDIDFFIIENERTAQIKNKQKLELQLLSLMKFLSNKISKDKFLFLNIYLKHYWPGFVKKYFPVSLPLNEIRRLGQTFRWGVFYPALWIKELQERSTQNDTQQYLSSFFQKSDSPKLWRKHFWLFALYTPVKEKVRHFFKQEVTKLMDAQSPYQRFLLIKVLSNSKLYTLIKSHLKFKSSLFNLKRKVFRSILERDHIINFALLHLIDIGDRNEDLLWWKVL